MTSLKLFLRTFFGFSSREVNGFMVLALLMLLFLLIPPTFDLCFRQPETALAIVAEAAPQVRSFSFDPNTASEQDLRDLGFSQSLVQRIVKYRTHYSFRKTEDLLRIYGMDSSLYGRIKDSVRIEAIVKATKSKDFHRKYSEKKGKRVVLDINACDSADLEKLKGIGPVLASRVVRYRQKLGGFVDTSQFKEVYGLKDFSLKELKSNVFIEDNFIPQKLKINRISLELLAAHPYVGWKSAKILVNYRTQHGPYTGKEALVNVKGLEQWKWECVLPYLDFGME